MVRRKITGHESGSRAKRGNLFDCFRSAVRAGKWEEAYRHWQEGAEAMVTGEKELRECMNGVAGAIENIAEAQELFDTMHGSANPVVCAVMAEGLGTYGSAKSAEMVDFLAGQGYTPSRDDLWNQLLHGYVPGSRPKRLNVKCIGKIISLMDDCRDGTLSEALTHAVVKGEVNVAEFDCLCRLMLVKGADFFQREGGEYALDKLAGRSGNAAKIVDTLNHMRHLQHRGNVVGEGIADRKNADIRFGRLCQEALQPAKK